jgi:EAL domain-containing protein (putative c-di-GMP-specific phosphodiesterase class I)
VVGAEALLRWRHPELGMVSPVEFIPLAEKSGLIVPIGSWVLESACAQLARWDRSPALSELVLAVNVSADQFKQPGFVSGVVTALDHHHVEPARLKLELTESMLANDLDDMVHKMAQLKGWGVGLSLDDFGTGYSSLGYLRRLPLDQIKIDASFVREILTSAHDAAIARTLVALARDLELEVIAEGVESELQRDFLESLGCLNYQGYFFSQPLPLAKFEDAMKVSRIASRTHWAQLQGASRMQPLPV